MSEENGTRLRVLLVEDEALVAMLIEDVLSEAGYQLVGAAPSLSAARAALERHGADMAILDVNLGGEPIFPFARALAEREIPFLFVTGYGEADIAP
jgi:DNA-binding response OmpR family regulator